MTTPSKPSRGRAPARLVLTALAFLLLLLLIAHSHAPAQTADDVAKKRKLPVEQIERMTTQRALSLPALLQLPDSTLRRVVQRLNYPNLQRERSAFWSLAQRDERGRIPFGARLKAISQLETLRKAQAAKNVAGLPSGPKVDPKMLLNLTAGVMPKGWTSIGPGNVGGRVRALVIHPTSPEVMWVGSVAGGIWRTDDGGKEFYPVDDFMINLVVTSLVMDPKNPKTMFAGTGEGFGNADGLRGAGIFQTTNGGVKWEQLAGTNSTKFHWVNRVAMSVDSKVLMAATRGDETGESGIYTSEDADRKVWTRRLAHTIGSLVTHPKDAKKAVAGGLRDGTAYYTEDAGVNWLPAKTASPWSGRVELTYALKNPSIVYASVDNNGGEIWQSTDGGKNYKPRSSGTSYLGEQGWYDNVIWAGDPNNADFVLVGGIDLWRSTDGGKTLKDISTWWARPMGASAHADHHLIVAHPNFGKMGNKTVFFGNDGGVYKTEDVTKVGNNANLPRINGWKELNNTFGVTQFYGAAGNAKSGVIVGGSQDNGTLRYNPTDGSEHWTEMFGGDGGYCASDPSDEKYFYGEYVYLNIHRSDDAGKTSDYISGQYWNGSDWAWKPIPYRIPDARNQQANFIAPFVLDPNQPKRILAGGMSLWRTDDAKAANTDLTGPKWTSIKNSVGSNISAIAVAPGNSDHVWVGHNNGDVYRTENGTKANPTWVKVDGNGATPLPNRYCTRITIDPTDRKTVYVTFGGYSKNNIWKTTNSGTNWKSLGASLPESPVRTLVVHPKNRKCLYIGTVVGVFASEDSGASWSSTNEGPTNCSVDELFWMDTTLVAATHGRGLFKIVPKVPAP